MQPSTSALRFLRTTASQTVRIWTLVPARPGDPVRADIAAMCRVVRVRAHLTPAHQAAFDQLAIAYPTTVLRLLVDRSDPEAVAAVQRQLDATTYLMPRS